MDRTSPLQKTQDFLNDLIKKRNITKAQAEVFNKKLDKIQDKYR
jgi:hypothetical protein